MLQNVSFVYSYSASWPGSWVVAMALSARCTYEIVITRPLSECQSTPRLHAKLQMHGYITASLIVIASASSTLDSFNGAPPYPTCPTHSIGKVVLHLWDGLCPSCANGDELQCNYAYATMGDDGKILLGPAYDISTRLPRGIPGCVK